jgi:hypothetical protein
MTDDQITAIWDGMPGKFMVEWGYQQFARKVLEAVERPTPDLVPLKTELRWCLENGMYGQRTGLALQWALDLLNETQEAEASNAA